HNAHVLFRFDTPAKINRHSRLSCNAFEDLPVAHPSFARAVQVYEVQATKTRLFKFLGHFQGMLIIYGLLCIIAMGQAYTFSVDDIYGGYDLHQSSRKFLMMRSPVPALFSVWNWTP